MAIPVILSKENVWPDGHDYRVTVTPVLEGNLDFRGPSTYYFLRNDGDAHELFFELKDSSAKYSKFTCVVSLDKKGSVHNPILSDLVG